MPSVIRTSGKTLSASLRLAHGGLNNSRSLSSPANPTSAVLVGESLKKRIPGDFSVTIRRGSLPGSYWTYDLHWYPECLVQNTVVGLGSRAAPNPQNSVLIGRQNNRRDLVS